MKVRFSAMTFRWWRTYQPRCLCHWLHLTMPKTHLTRCWCTTRTHLIFFCYSATAAQILRLKAFYCSWTQIYPASVKYGMIVKCRPKVWLSMPFLSKPLGDIEWLPKWGKVYFRGQVVWNIYWEASLKRIMRGNHFVWKTSNSWLKYLENFI